MKENICKKEKKLEVGEGLPNEAYELMKNLENFIDSSAMGES